MWSVSPILLVLSVPLIQLEIIVFLYYCYDEIMIPPHVNSLKEHSSLSTWSEKLQVSIILIPRGGTLDFNRSFTLWARKNGWLIDCTDWTWIQPRASISGVFNHWPRGHLSSAWLAAVCSCGSFSAQHSKWTQQFVGWTVLMYVYSECVQSSPLLLCVHWVADCYWHLVTDPFVLFCFGTILYSHVINNYISKYTTDKNALQS